MNNNKQVSDWYENSYKTSGLDAQRRYPNEEFCRFMGRNFFSIPQEKRQDIKVLETGCGSGANLWMIAREGFSSYGIDLSAEAIDLCKKMLESYGVSADLSVQDMMKLSFPDQTFHAIADVFSSYCLSKDQHLTFLMDVYKKLKNGGLFFSYFPSKASGAFQFPGKSTFIDQDTLSSISRADSPFCGQDYPFRFSHHREYEADLEKIGFEIQYSEKVSRTYNTHKELFEFVVVEARKI